MRDKLVTVRGRKIYLSRLIALSIWTIGSLGVTIWLAIQPWNPIALFTGMLFLVTCCGWYFTLTDKDGKEHDKAIADFNKAIELDPEYALAYSTRGFAYTKLGEKEKAISDFEKCIELSENPAFIQVVQEMLDKLRA